MKNLKRVGVLAVLVCTLLIALSISVMADPIDDAMQGKLSIGQVVTVGSYDYYYMGNGYFICTTVPTNAMYHGNGSSYNNWACSTINYNLNNGSINLGTTGQGVGIYADTRVAYVTIPSLEEYEQLSCMEKGNGTLTYWLRSPCYTNSAYIWIVYGGSVGSSGDFKAPNSQGVRPAFRLKSDFSGSITNNVSRSTVFKVLQNTAFTEAIHGELNGSNNGVTASSTAGSGYTTLTGTFSTVGIQKATIGSTILLFKVIAPPSTSSSASVSFSS